MSKTLFSTSLALVLSLSLAACNDTDDTKNLSRLDAELTNNTMDPVARAALEDPLAVDADLSGQSNDGAVRPGDKPLTGAIPANLSPKDARAYALKLAGGKLMETPAATKTITSTKEPVTLGGKAEQTQGGKCGAPQVKYAMKWASRMPASFPVYPGGNVTEAAGADNAPCNLRAVSFTTPVPKQEVMIGGALGALGRYQFGRLSTHMLGMGWPWGTFGVNIIGGLLMGLLAGWLARFNIGGGEQVRLLIGVGFLGGFTTFSSFSLEVMLMIERGQWSAAAAYALFSVLLSVGALFLGLLLIRSFA